MADQLAAMGFDRSQAEVALSKVNGSIERAMDLLLAGPVNSKPTEGRSLGDTSNNISSSQPSPPKPSENSGGSGGTETDQVARSIKCDDCGKVMRNEQEAETHAARTQHVNFSQSTEEKKALTAEEKAAQFKKLQERMQQKKEEKMKQAMEDKIEREKIRRIEGQRKGNIKEDFERKRMLKEAAERKAEKIEAAKAKAKVKAQIEQDRINRRAKTSENNQGPISTAPNPPTKSSTPDATTPKKSYDVCKIRLQLKPPISSQFEPTKTVNDIFEWARSAAPSLAGQQFTLGMTRPRKVFTAGDLTVIADSGLMPSAALTVQIL